MTSGRQQGDVLLYQQHGGGEIDVSAGLISMSGGLETSAYLSLFGGNTDDDGRKDSKFGWWGNADETNPIRHYVSLTQNLLKALPATSANLRRIEDAALTDLKWMTETGVASDVTAAASLTGINRIQLDISINSDDSISQFTFIQNWQVLL